MRKKTLLLIILILSLLVSVSFAESYSASSIRLLRHEGTVEILDPSGTPRFLLDNVRFASGESLRTGEDGKASVGLDDSKIVTMDANSHVTFIQEDNHMQLNLLEGSLFLDVQKKIDENASFDIQTTTMTVGIRGTIVCITYVPAHDGLPASVNLCVMEGTGHVTFRDESGSKRVIDVSAGNKIVVPVTDDSSKQGVTPQVSLLVSGDLPTYVIDTVKSDETLTNRIIEGSENGAQLLSGEPIVESGEGEKELWPADGDWTWDSKVSLLAQSASKLYDGLPLSRPSDALVFGLPGNFRISVTSTGSITNAGSTDNVISSYSIYNGSGENVTSHFTNIETVKGSLVVAPAPLVVWTGSAEKPYDGTPLTCPDAGIRTVPSHTPEDPAWQNTSLVTQTALGSEKMVALSGRTYVHGTNPLTGETRQLELLAGQTLSVCLHDEGDSQSLEFQIDTLAEKDLPEEVLRVYQKNPDLLAKACEDTGWNPDTMKTLIAALPAEKATNVVSASGLKVDSEDKANLMTDSTNVRIHIDSGITNYSTRPLNEEEASFTPITLDPSIVITATGSQLQVGESKNGYTIDWGNADSRNYTLKEDLGTLVVTDVDSTPVTISGGSASKTYDGESLSAHRFNVQGLPDGYTVKATCSGSITDVGTARNSVTSYTILDSEGTDVTSKFTNVKTQSGTLTVTPAELTVTTGTASKVYDGEPLTCADASISGLVNGETADVTANGSVTAVGSAENTCSISWGSAKESNYTVTKELGTLTVEALSMSIDAGGGSVDYTGKAPELDPVLTYNNGPHAGQSVHSSSYLSGSARVMYLAAAGRTPARSRAAGDASWIFDLYTGDTVTLTISGLDGSVGTHTLTANVTSTLDISGINVSLSGLTVTVLPRTLAFDLGGMSITYKQDNGDISLEPTLTVSGGDTLSAESVEVLSDGHAIATFYLEDDTEITLDITGFDPLADVGTYTLSGDFSVSGTMDASSFTATYSNTTFTVTPCEVEFDLGGTSYTLLDPFEEPMIGIVRDLKRSLHVGEMTFCADIILDTGDETTLYVENYPEDTAQTGTYVLTGRVEFASGKKSNYTFSYTGNKVTIGKATIIVSKANETMTYCGESGPLSTDLLVTGAPYGLDYYAELNYSEPMGPDVGTYQYVARTWVDYDYIDDVEFDTSGMGTLTIEKATLTIGNDEMSKTYDGEPLTLTEEDLNVSGLAPADEETISFTLSNNSVTKGGQSVTPEITVNWGEVKQTNYDWSVSPKALTVKKAPLTIKTPSAEKDYDGTALTTSMDGVEINGLIEGDEIAIRLTGTQTEPGKSNNTFEIDMEHSINADCYEITPEYGTLYVHDKPVIIFDLAGGTKYIYDDTEDVSITPTAVFATCSTGDSVSLTFREGSPGTHYIYDGVFPGGGAFVLTVTGHGHTPGSYGIYYDVSSSSEEMNLYTFAAMNDELFLDYPGPSTT